MITARGLAAAGVCLLLSAVLMARPPRTANGNEVSGVYAIQTMESTSANYVRLTLHVILSSSSDAMLQSKSVSLRSVLSSTTQTLSVTFSIPAHGSTDFTASAIITVADYKSWQEGGRPLLVLNLQSLDGTEITRTVELIPAVHAEAK